VSFLHRDFRDRTAGIDINAIYEDGVFKGYKDVTQNTILLVTNNTYNWPVYTGLELLATKQTARLQLLGSYTRQWRHIDGTWLPNDPASIVQPEVFPNDDGIGDTNGSTGDFNSLTGTNMVCCNLVLWRDHAFRAAAVYQAPWDLTVATSYTYQSNLWAGPTVDRIAAPDPRFGPTTVTLSNGRVVPNPLATTIRFVGPTRGDNQVRLPSTHVWNLRIGRAFHFGDRRLEPSVDIFNIPNNGADQFTNFGQTNQRYSPNYGKGLQKQLPRSAQVSVRFIF
jgi:hypothetical protein